MPGITERHHRHYINRVRHDPRTRAIADSWVHQAMMEAEARYLDRRDREPYTLFLAKRVLELAMSFVLDNDGEYQQILAEYNRLFDEHRRVLSVCSLPPFSMKAGE